MLGKTNEKRQHTCAVVVRRTGNAFKCKSQKLSEKKGVNAMARKCQHVANETSPARDRWCQGVFWMLNRLPKKLKPLQVRRNCRISGKQQDEKLGNKLQNNGQR